MVAGCANDEAGLRARIERWAAAIRAKDLDGVIAIYAQDIVSFDVEAPLQYSGLEAKAKRWSDTFALYERVFDYEIRDLTIASGDSLAFGRSLNRLSGILVGGNQSGFWVRWTACFRKIEGTWLIGHEQVSTPIDPKRGTACLNLKP
jgi:ketosteroid isomerase-like protein